MKTLLYVLLGIVVGALAGLVVAFVGVALWYDVLGIGSPGGDQLSGVTSFMALALVLAPVGAVAGAVLMGRRGGPPAEANGGGGGSGSAWTAIVLLVVLVAAGLWLAGLVAV